MTKPLMPALANTPSAASDAALAAEFAGNGYNVWGRLSDRDRLVFEFRGARGELTRYSGAQLKEQTWWYWLPEDDALSIEASLYPSSLDRRFAYVARADNAAGGRLIGGSRLSGFFEGPSGYQQASDECVRLRSAWPDAGVFTTDSIEDAERLLAAEDMEAESHKMTLARMAAARAKRFAALLS